MSAADHHLKSLRPNNGTGMVRRCSISSHIPDDSPYSYLQTHLRFTTSSYNNGTAYVQECSIPQQSTILGVMIVLDLFFNSILDHKPILAFF